jgi:hypothetical protein
VAPMICGTFDGAFEQGRIETFSLQGQ